MIRDTIHVVADNPMAGPFVIICALIGLSVVCNSVTDWIRAAKK